MTHPYDGRRREPAEGQPEEARPDPWENRPRVSWPGRGDDRYDEPDELADRPDGGLLRLRAAAPVAAAVVALAGAGIWLGLGNAAGPPDPVPAAAGSPGVSLMEVPGQEVVITPSPGRTTGRTQPPATAQPVRAKPTPRPATREPGVQPVAEPSTRPTVKPSARPSRKPTAKTSAKPSAKPSATRKPTPEPSPKPSEKPSTTRPPAQPPTQQPTGGEPEPTCDNWVDCHDLPPDF
ncbi:hypothetical protein [Nonomuraea typhae]|uniref:Uncharacterized protein n=1 Tax=Nonomuraea typhae TaxID=2603600 RepID=A0ABW7YN78_9ACTN